KIMTAIFSENTTLLLLIITVIVMSMLLHYILQKNKDLLKNQYDKQIQELSLIAEQDQLTGLYNKKTIEGFIKNHIKENHEENGALFIIDVDNFKTINDTLGHLFGDMVLEQLAAKLKGLFRENDLLGRIGGDEFFVFIKNMTDDDIVTQKATLIVEAFNNTYSSDEESVQVSASIGVALFPQHGRTLDVLYEKADIALYDTKIKGKNGYTIYSGNKASKYISNRDTSIENSSSTGFSVAPEKTVFNLLYSVKNQDFAINSVLQLIGEKYGACRASIFMLEKDNTLKNTFEWRGAGVPSRMNLLQKVEQHTFANVVNELIENQIYIATSIEQVQSSWLHHDLTKNEIKSFFLQALYVNCDFIGFISFDYCKEGFIPKNEDLNNIASISQILALFLKLNSYK
ncbi:MAG: GGDEF domain-containing protein, partial [Anaerotignaceae bacterium]